MARLNPILAAETGGNAPAKSLILLGRKRGGNGGNGMSKSLKTLKAETETSPPTKVGRFRAPSVGEVMAQTIGGSNAQRG